MTPFGGLALAARRIARLGIRSSINSRVKVFENKRGYDEATVQEDNSCVHAPAKSESDYTLGT